MHQNLAFQFLLKKKLGLSGGTGPTFLPGNSLQVWTAHSALQSGQVYLSFHGFALSFCLFPLFAVVPALPLWPSVVTNLNSKHWLTFFRHNCF